MGAPSDLGLFGPGSVTWKVHSDPIMGVAEARAVLLRLLHPLATQPEGSAGGGLWDPVRIAGEYVMTTTFGTTAEANRAAERAAALFSSIPGIDSPGIGSPGIGSPGIGTATGAATDRPSDAPPPDLELRRWVHCCNVDSYLSVARRAGLRLTDQEADGYVAEQVRVARRLGIPADQVPSTTAALALYFERTRPRLRASLAARQAAAALFWPRMRRWVALGTPARPIWIGVVGLGFATLPPWARKMYGLPGLPTTEPLGDLAVATLRRGLRAVPRPIRESAQVAEAKRRVAATPVMRLDSLRSGVVRGTPPRASGPYPTGATPPRSAARPTSTS